MRGVLYGVVEVDKFQLHQDMDGEEQNTALLIGTGITFFEEIQIFFILTATTCLRISAIST